MRVLLASLSFLCVIAPAGCQPDDDGPPWNDGGDDTPTPAATPLPGTDGVEAEPNGAMSSANAILLDQGISGSMGLGDDDYFRLEIPGDFAGYKVTITVDDADGTCFEGVDANLEILSESGTSLSFVEDSFEHYCPMSYLTPAPGDVYFIKVGTDYSLSGPYVLKVAVGGPGTIDGVLTSDFEPENKGQSPLASRGAIMAGEVLISLKGDAPRGAFLERLSQGFPGARLRQEVMGGRYLHVDVPLAPGAAPRGRTIEVIEAIRAMDGVLKAEPNGVLQPQALTPDDPYFANGSQWHYEPFPGINLPEAWEYSVGDEGVIVGIIDTGHDSTHPDLMNKAVPGYDFISDLTSAGDGDGPDDDAEDTLRSGHGSHVAGTVAADTDNGVGVAGVGWSVSYMPLRVCGDFGCTEADIGNAMYYAAGYAVLDLPGRETPRAEVINLSLGGHDICSPLMQEIISAARYRGVLVVVSAGNSGDDASFYSPASCGGVLTVAATDGNADRAGFSNYGSSVDIAAPGVQIVSTYHGSQYASLQGTSMSAPHVAGAAALVKSVNPDLNHSEVEALMMDTAAPLSCGSRSCGAGLLDVAALLDEALDANGEGFGDVVLVQAVSEGGEVVTTVAAEGEFLLVGLPPGSYSLRVGIEVDGDRDLSEGEILFTDEGPYVVSELGEDFDNIVLPAL